MRMNALAVGLFMSLGALVPVGSWAKGVEGLRNRFTVIREDGVATRIVDRSLGLRRNLKSEVWAGYEAFKSMMQSKAMLGDVDDDTLEDDFRSVRKGKEQDVDYDAKIGNILRRMSSRWQGANKADEKAQMMAADAIFDKLEKDLEVEGGLFGAKTVAHLENSSYFYKRKVFRTLIRLAIGQLKDVIPGGAVLNWAIFFLKRYESYLYDTIKYHRHMLYHYLNQYGPEGLGLSGPEYDKALSSVHEGNIGVYNFIKHWKAKKNWDDFGQNEHDKYNDKVEERQDEYEDRFESVGARLDLMHYEVETKKGKGKALVDFYTKKSVLSKSYSSSFYYKSPKKVLGKRVFLELVNFALDFATLPPGVGKLIEYLIDSMYSDQVTREGLLAAHFEDIGNLDMQKKIMLQTVNPVGLGLEKAWRELHQ